MKNNLIKPNTEQRAEIVKLIRENLLRGDIKKLAEKHHKKKQDFYNVIKGNSWRRDLVKLLYDKAIENKKTLNSMLNGLKTTPVHRKK